MKEVIEQKSEKKEYIKPRVVDHGSAQSKTQSIKTSPSCLGGGPPATE
ncbi:MAG TPA: hypothetical protein VHY37_13255 [Tepidisphaeraceae bacterium]|nr:hypothetical protein [Tepidisphaeraceae bacterium]